MSICSTWILKELGCEYIIFLYACVHVFLDASQSVPGAVYDNPMILYILDAFLCNVNMVYSSCEFLFETTLLSFSQLCLSMNYEG